MPLKPNVAYTIRNELTHTVLDLSNDHIPGCWGWHGKSSQQWKLIRVGDAGTHTWKLQNQHDARLLSRDNVNVNYRLRGLVPNENEDLVQANVCPTANFVIKPIREPSEIYRIQFNNSAVTLITGQGEDAAGFPEDGRVFDLHADGPPLALRGVPAEPHPIDSAQLWSFCPVVQLPLEPGTYKIISSHARLLLDLAVDGGANHNVRGIRGGGNDNPKWVVSSNGNGYTFRSSRLEAAGPFLSAPAPNVAANNNVVGGEEANAKTFTVRNVPGTHLYKIFLHANPKLAINISINDALQVLFLQEEAQMWAFELVQ